jgi:hypothetical protein
MTELEQAIKIEQLKDEKAKTINPLKLELIREVEPSIRSIDNQILELQKKRNALNAHRFELKNRISNHEKHFDILIKAYIKAYQCFAGENTK